MGLFIDVEELRKSYKFLIEISKATTSEERAVILDRIIENESK